MAFKNEKISGHVEKGVRLWSVHLHRKSMVCTRSIIPEKSEDGAGISYFCLGHRGDPQIELSVIAKGLLGAMGQP